MGDPTLAWICGDCGDLFKDRPPHGTERSSCGCPIGDLISLVPESAVEKAVADERARNLKAAEDHCYAMIQRIRVGL